MTTIKNISNVHVWSFVAKFTWKIWSSILFTYTYIFIKFLCYVYVALLCSCTILIFMFMYLPLNFKTSSFSIKIKEPVIFAGGQFSIFKMIYHEFPAKKSEPVIDSSAKKNNNWPIQQHSRAWGEYFTIQFW